MVAGLMKPDEGEIWFMDEKLKDPEEQLIAGNQYIKLVFQDFQLKPNMTVAENIKYQLFIIMMIIKKNELFNYYLSVNLKTFANKKLQ